MTCSTRALLAEFLGTGALLAGVVGSGIMGERLSAGNAAIALLANSGATGCLLYVLIALLAPASGAHFNPAVSLVMRARGELPTAATLGYIAAQVAGAVAGVLLAHAMFELPLVQPGTQARTGFAQWLGECVATFGLVSVIVLGRRHRPHAVAALVACYIFAGYWFTSSTCLANPAATLGRSLTDSFAGIRIGDVSAFVMAQLAGAGLAYAVTCVFEPRRRRAAL